MINGFYIGENEFESFKETIQEKQQPGKKRLEEIQDDVENAYVFYLDHFETIVTRRPIIINDHQRAALKLCYESRSATFKKQRGEVFSKQPDVLQEFCPYCLLNKPKTLDHYTPKNEFPEYSILLKNLIPCCADCNTAKDELWRRDNQRSFIHFYKDTFIKYKFLSARINVNNGVPVANFTLRKPPEISAGEYKIVKSHFKELDLLSLYRKRSNTILSTEIKSLNRSIENGQVISVLKDILVDKSESYSEDYGVNYWAATLYSAMASSLEYLIRNR